MALVVPCATCGTKLAAPDSAAGKRLRCPKCGALATAPALVPAEEVPVVEAKVTAPPKAKPKPAPDTNSTICLVCNSMVLVVGEITDGLIHCPKCGFANPAPTNRVEPAEGPEDARPHKKPRVRATAVDEDDEDDEDDRPRKKKRPRYADEDDEYDHDRRKKPRRKSGGGGALIAGLVIGGLLLLAGLGLVAYLIAGKGSVLAKKTPVPPGWEQQNYPQDGFKLYTPKGANYVSIPTDGFQPGGRFGGRPRFGPGGLDWADDLPQADRVAVVTAGNWNDPVRVEVYVVKFRARIPSSVRDQMRRGLDELKVGDVQMRKTTWLGYDAVEQTHPGGVMRVAYAERHAIVASISGPNASRAKPEEEAGFFDNLELTD